MWYLFFFLFLKFTLFQKYLQVLFKPFSHLWSRLRSRCRHKHSVKLCEVTEARVKYEASSETRILKNFGILLISCLKIDLTSHLLHDVCNVNASSYVRKVVSHEACQKNQNGITAKRTTFWGCAIPSFIHWSRYGLQAQK